MVLNSLQCMTPNVQWSVFSPFFLNFFLFLPLSLPLSSPHHTLQTMSIPSSEGSKKFQFKTAPEGQGSLECLHQSLDHSKRHQVGM